MARNNVTFFERHTEKMILGLTLLVLLWVLYGYALDTPNKVEIGGELVGPAEVDPKINRVASRLERMLQQEKIHSPKLAELTVPPYTPQFANRLKQNLLADQQFRLAASRVAPLGEPSGAAPGKEPYHVPDVPAPALAAARAQLGTIDPVEIEQNQELADRFPDGGPYDTAWVSVLGTFPLKKMLEELSSSGQEGRQKLPTDWWRRTFAIAEVQLQRQEQRPDGTWPQKGDPDYSKLTELAPPMPGRLSFRGIPEQVKPAQAGQYLHLMQQYQMAIIQPPFYTLRGEPWTPPTPGQGNRDFGEQQKEILDLREKIKREERIIKSLQRQVDQLEGRDRNRGRDNRQRDAGRPPGVGPGGIPEGFDPGAARPRGGQRGGQRNRTTDRQRSRADQLRDRVQQHQQKLEDLQKKFKEATGQEMEVETQRSRPTAPRPGAMPEDYEQFFRGEGGPPPGAFPGPGQGRPAPGRRDSGGDQRAREELRRLQEGRDARRTAQQQQGDQRAQRLGMFTLDESKLEVWANDLSVEPGKTYRYRMRVVIVNPLFNKDALPKEQASKYQDQFTMQSDWSDWSGPRRVQRMDHFFLVSGSPNPKPGQATVEVWKYYNGRWRNRQFTVQPGDPIGQQVTIQREGGDERRDREEPRQLTIDFSTGHYVVDLDFDFPVAGNFQNMQQTTTRMLYLTDRGITARRLDKDRDAQKRKWLQTQQELAATGSSGAVGFAE